MNTNKILIDGKIISSERPPYIIAELSANHNGSLKQAIETISMAKESGADAVKIQTYSADTMTIDSPQKDFQINEGLWQGKSLYQLYQQAQTPFAWHKELFEHARAIGITLFSSPFDETAVDLLESLNCPAYKLASFELTDIPLIEYIAKTGKPMIMSTGMANKEEIAQAIDTAKEAGCQQLVVLHCISAYPAPLEQCNLLTMKDLNEHFDVMTGLSDHTLGTTAAVTATALGACLIEKHVTLSRKEKGPDSEFSLEPGELKQLVNEIKAAWSTIGKITYKQQLAEQQNVKFRRSLYFIKDIKAGEVITNNCVRRIRPGYGLPPKYHRQVVGLTARKDIHRGTPVQWKLLNKK